MKADPALIEKLRRSLEGPLPGHDGLPEVSGYRRPDPHKVLQRDPPPREGAVLVLIYPRDQALHTLLMLRPVYEGVHSGQISFPGGKKEEQDRSLEETALREFNEETGAMSDEILVLGRLSPIFIPPSDVVVTPVIAYTTAVSGFDPDPNEVAELIETPLADLLHRDLLRSRKQHVSVLGRELEVPYYDVKGHVVWGATAMMIAELRELFHRLGQADRFA